jgi:hypothetical protein
MTDKDGNVTSGVTIRLTNQTVAMLKSLARHESAQKDEQITFTDLIRRAIKQTYPITAVRLRSPSDIEREAFEMSRNCGD